MLKAKTMTGGSKLLHTRKCRLLSKLEGFFWFLAICCAFFLPPVYSSLELDAETVMIQKREGGDTVYGKGSGATNRTKFYAADILTLEKLAYKELEVIKIFVNDPETTRKLPVIKTIKKYLRAFTTATNMRIKGGVNWTEASMLEDMTKIADNPIAAFSLIHRTHKYWPRIFNSSTNSSGQMRNETELDGKVETRDEKKEPILPQVTEWPLDEDVQESLHGLTLIVFTYDLDVPQFATGNFSGFETHAKLNSEQCAMLADFADKLEHPARAVEWQELAISRIKTESPGKSTEKLENKLQLFENKHDSQKMAHMEETPHLFEYLILMYKKCHENDDFGSCESRRRIKQSCPPRSGHDDIELSGCYETILCNGQNYQTNEQRSKLFCWYESARHPYFRIGPIKMEFLSIDPDIVQMYDVITDKMLNRLLALASSRYIKASSQSGMDLNKVKFKDSYDSGRNAMYAWLLDKNGTWGLMQIPRMIEMLTGLEVASAGASENVQVASYSFSGYFSSHQDAFGGGNVSLQWEFGDRMATFMYYLSDVTAGGYTAFVEAGVAARPIKKSAVFWYNTFGGGKVDGRLSHAACPVVFGRKIVANKWIRSFRQAFNHPTPLDPKDAFRILANGKIPS